MMKRRTAVLVAVLGLALPQGVLDARTRTADWTRGTAKSGDADAASPIPPGTRPCEHPEYWPLSVASKKHEFLVHYRLADEEEMANKVVMYLDTAWDFEVGTLGFREPVLPDAGCGPDGRFDVFLWRGNTACQVDAIDPEAEEGVSCRPTMTYMLLDPWGKYGGDVLRQTIGHEFNHASQAVLDWNETLIALEMTATYVEQYFWDAYPRSILDFQRNPERSLLWVNADDTDPDSRSFLYMYGSALYLRFLRDRYFPDDERFAARLWEMLPNADCTRNSPNIVDGLDRLLNGAEPPSSFLHSAIEFARWRYFTGKKDDHRHFRTWPMPFAQAPFIAEANLSLDGAAKLHREGTTRYQVTRAPMILGSSYVEVVAGDADQAAFEIVLTPKLDASRPPTGKCSPYGLKWVVQAVPGVQDGEDGEIVDVSRRPARIAFKRGGRAPSRTLIVSLLPSESFDPDDQCDEVFPFELRFRPLK